MANQPKSATTKTPKTAKAASPALDPTPATDKAITPEAALETILAKNLPTPELLAAYEKIVPGGAARLFELAERHARQARELEHKAFTSRIFLAKFSQITQFILALTAGVFGGALLLNGSELAGLIIILVDAAIIACGVIYGKPSQN